MVHLLWRNWKRRGMYGKAEAIAEAATLQAKNASHVAAIHPDALNAVWPR